MIVVRRHEIDWLRVIAIGLLLIYHIAIIFQPWAMLIGFIKSDEPVEALWIPMTMLNVWRIPLLFCQSIRHGARECSSCLLVNRKTIEKTKQKSNQY